MALRAMNNTKKAAAKILKESGYNVFWQVGGPRRRTHWATHPKLIGQYCIVTKSSEAMEDLKRKVDGKFYQEILNLQEL